MFVNQDLISCAKQIVAEQQVTDPTEIPKYKGTFVELETSGKLQAVHAFTAEGQTYLIGSLRST
jgi:hypothetical protein